MKKVELKQLGDDLMDFFQSGNELRIAGLIPDFEVPAPEGEHRELQGHVTRALALLPRGWRTAIVLYHVEGQSLAEIAKVNSITEDEAKRYLQYAREYLRQILLESGLKLRKSAGADSQTKAVKKAAR
jgi:DNA-directed RNA polymerase specialized sigma24 family protein